MMIDHERQDFASRFAARPSSFTPRSMMRPLALVLTASLLVACASDQATRTTGDEGVAGADMADAQATDAMLLEGDRVAMLWVNGMGCPLCANNVERQLHQLDGVERVTVNLGTGLITAHLSADARPTSEQLRRAVTNSGFTLVRSEVSP